MSTTRRSVHEVSWLAKYSPNQIATGVGTTGTVVCTHTHTQHAHTPRTPTHTFTQSLSHTDNIFGIPLDRFRLLVAQDMKCAESMTRCMQKTLSSPQAAFIGYILLKSIVRVLFSPLTHPHYVAVAVAQPELA